MIVTSALELYTQLFAWHMYTATAQILFGTGLALVPFVLVTIDTLLDSWENDWDSERLIKSLESQVYTMLIVVFFALSPSINVYFTGAEYAYTSCEDEDRTTEVKDGETGTTFDREASRIAAIYSDRQPKAPLWWYTTIKLWQGISGALIQEIPCSADMTTVAQSLASTVVKDPALKEELTQFYGDCYLKASNQFLANIPPEDEKPSGLKENAIFEDVSWIGSQFFSDHPAYYAVMRPSKEVKAFPYSELRDNAISPPPPSGVDAGGYPSCYEWWTGVPPEGASSSDADGLQNRLIAHIKEVSPDSLDSSFMDVFSYDSADEAEVDRLRIALTVADGPGDPLSLPAFGNAYSDAKDQGAIGQFFNNTSDNVVMGLSGLWNMIPTLFETTQIRQAVIIVDALVKMMFTLLLPLILFLSLYSIRTLITITAVQMSFYMWSYIFAICYWLNNFLFGAMMGDKPLSFFKNLATGQESTLAPLITLGWIVMYSYIFLPLFFSAIIGIAGKGVGSGLERQLNMKQLGGLGSQGKGLPKPKTK